MFGIFALLLIVMPIVELYVIFQVAEGIGGLETFGLLIAISVFGAWLVRREGSSVVRRAQALLAGGEMPTNQIVDGILVAVAGALLLTPGFVTDAVGFLLLIPPSRVVVRTLIVRRYRHRFTVGGAATGAGSGVPGGPGATWTWDRTPGAPGFGRDVVDIDEVDLERDDSDPPAIDPTE